MISCIAFGTLLKHTDWKHDTPQFHSLPLLLGGDFNFCANGAPKIGYVPSEGHSDDLLNEELGGLEELGNLQEKFPNPYIPTWQAPTHYSDMNTRVVRPAATLDRVFISSKDQSCLQITANIRLRELELSDHLPIEVTANSATSTGQPKNLKHKLSTLLSCPIPAKVFAVNNESIRLLRSHTFNILAQHGYANLSDFGININVHDDCHVKQRSTPNFQPPLDEMNAQPVMRSAPGDVFQTYIAAVRLWYMFFARNQRTRATNPLSKGTLRRIRHQIEKIEQASLDKHLLETNCYTAQLAAVARNLLITPCLNPQQSMAQSAFQRAFEVHSTSPVLACKEYLQWVTEFQEELQNGVEFSHEVTLEASDGKPKEKTAWMQLASLTFPKFVKSPPVTSDINGLPFDNEIDEEFALRQNRHSLWTTIDSIDTNLQRRWIAEYQREFVQDSKLLLPIPSISTILATLLKSGPSAPGLDGIPYEAWKIAPLPLTRVFHQFFHDLAIRPGCDPILGRGSVDLTVFIPKAAGLTSASSQRPLSIPPTWLRLISAIGMEQIGEQWSSQLHQAATALKGKGDCAANVRRLQDFISWFHVLPTYHQKCAKTRMSALLPPILNELLTQLEPLASALSVSKSLAFVDQVKAYEVISHDWLIQCWSCLPMSTWIWQWLHLVVLNRKVRIRVRGYLGPLIPLVKGLGMGGPHAPHTWAVGFDPIVWMLDIVAGTYLTTVYADDTSLANNHNQALLHGQVLLLCANQVAGLQVAHHHCLSATFTFQTYGPYSMDFNRQNYYNKLKTNLCLPLIIKDLKIVHPSHSDRYIVTFNTASSVFACSIMQAAIKMAHMEIDGEVQFTCQRLYPCKCECKCDLILSPLTATVCATTSSTLDQILYRQQILNSMPPQANKLLHDPMLFHILQGTHTPASPMPTSSWLAIIQNVRYRIHDGDPLHDIGALCEAEISLWGFPTLASSARYLGPSIARPLTGGFALQESLQKPWKKFILRVQTAAAVRSSWNVAVYMWNLHIIPCLYHIFASHYISSLTHTSLLKQARIALRTGNWISPQILFAISGCLGVPGFPTCPFAAAIASYCVAGLRTEFFKRNSRNATYGNRVDESWFLERKDTNPLGLKMSAAMTSNFIFKTCLVNIDDNLPNFISSRATDLLRKEQLKLTACQNSIVCGIINFQKVRRIIYRILLLKDNLQFRGGYQQLLTRSLGRTFGATQGQEWENLARLAKCLSPLICYDFTKCWLNGFADDRRMRHHTNHKHEEKSRSSAQSGSALHSAPLSGLLPCILCGQQPPLAPKQHIPTPTLTTNNYIDNNNFHLSSSSRFSPFGITDGRTLCINCSVALANTCQNTSENALSNSPVSPRSAPLWALLLDPPDLQTFDEAFYTKLAKNISPPTTSLEPAHYLQNQLERLVKSPTITGFARAPCDSNHQPQWTCSQYPSPTEDLFHCRLCLQGEYSTEHTLWWCPVVFNGLSIILNRNIEPILSNPLLLSGVDPQNAHSVGLWLRTCLLTISNRRTSSTAQLLSRGISAKTTLQTLLALYWQSLPAKWKPRVTPRVIMEAIDANKLTKTTPLLGICKQASEMRSAHFAYVHCITFAAASSLMSTALLHPETLRKPVTIAHSNIGCGQSIAFTCVAESRLLWPLRNAFHEVLPGIRHAHVGQVPNVELRAHKCACEQQGLSLKTICNISKGEEILLSLAAPLWTLRPTTRYLSIMFDGSCPQPRATSPCAGAGIVILTHEPNGVANAICTIRAAIPGKANAQIAEAVGLRLSALYAAQYGLKLIQQHHCEYLIIRGDSKVLAMDMNGYGVITAEAMSTIIAPVKLWLQQGSHIKSFQHVSRSFNTLADKAANEAASTAALLVSSPSIQHIIVAAHALPCDDVKLQLCIVVANQALKLKYSRNREYELCAILQLLLLTFNFAHGLSDPSASNDRALKNEAKQFFHSLTPQHKNLLQLDVCCITRFSLPCIPATLIRYLSDSAIPVEQCSSLLQFLSICSHASFFPSPSLSGNSPNMSNQEQTVIIPTVCSSTSVLQDKAKSNDLEATLLASTPRPLGLPLVTGEYDEFVWALLFGTIPNSIIVSAALCLARMYTIASQDLVPADKEHSIHVIWGLLDEIQEQAHICIVQHSASPSLPILAILSKKIKLAILGVTEVFPIFKLPETLEKPVSLLAAQFKHFVSINISVADKCLKRVQKHLQINLTDNKSHKNATTQCPQSQPTNDNSEPINSIRSAVSLTLHLLLRFMYQFVTEEAYKYHVQTLFIIGTTFAFTLLPEFPPPGINCNSAAQCQLNVNLLFNQLLIQWNKTFDLHLHQSSTRRSQFKERSVLSNGIVAREALQLLLICDQRVWSTPPHNNVTVQAAAAKSATILANLRQVNNFCAACFESLGISNVTSKISPHNPPTASVLSLPLYRQFHRKRGSLLADANDRHKRIRI